MGWGRIFGALFLLVPALAPAAVTLDFSELHGADGCSFAMLDSHGFHIEVTFGHFLECHSFIPGDPALQAVGFGEYSFARVTTLDGGRFRFLGLDVSSNGVPNGQISVLGHVDGGGALNQAMMVNSVDHYEHMVCEKPDAWLDDLYIQVYPTLTSPSMNFDNVRLETVPEPCTLALSGLALVIGVRRRRQVKG